MRRQLLTKAKLLKDFANSSDKLFNLGIIRTDSFTGEIGEFVASKYFKLNLAGKSTKDYDAECSKGYKYQIKSKIVNGNSFNYCISNLKSSAFDFLIVVYFDKYYTPLVILKIPSKEIVAEKYSVNSTKISLFSQDMTRLKLSEKERIAIKDFAQCYLNLQEAGIIRSRKVVGDIGEYYACEYLNLELCSNSNEKGFDAIGDNNSTYEIKTRRVYDSGRRISNVRRINNLSGKSADYLIVVTLNHAFECSGMWIMPMKNVTNPTSANLTIVNTTVGVKNIVPSQIDWLVTGEEFVSLDNMEVQTQSPIVGNKCSKNDRSQSNDIDSNSLEIRNYNEMHYILYFIIGLMVLCLFF